jgi:hypothetical protein
VQARRLRREVRPGRVGPANDDRQCLQGGLPQVVVLEEGVEAAELAVMRERLGTGDIVGGRADLGGDVEYLVGGDIDELRAGFDEAPDQPRAGDTIDFGVFACNPFHAASPWHSLPGEEWDGPASPASLASFFLIRHANPANGLIQLFPTPGA